ncbi:hypothetical protein ACTNCG_09500, partial [Catenibacterium mitsuokai]
MNYTLEDIKKQSPYPIGELNTAYAKYFVGNSYKFVGGKTQPWGFGFLPKLNDLKKKKKNKK